VSHRSKSSGQTVPGSDYYFVMRIVFALILATGLAGCDLAGTAVATGAGASAELKQAQGAQQTEEQVRQQVEQATHAHMERIQQSDTEKDAQ
jgi:hypothetical protein